MTVASASSRSPVSRNQPCGVQLRLELKPAMSQVFRSPARHRMLLSGRRSGKTWLSIASAIAEGMGCSGTRVHYLAPTLVQSRAIAWDLLLNLLPASWIASKNVTAMELKLRNGSTIKLGGLDHADALRGQSSHLLILDEFCYANDLRTSWQGALRPLLSTTAGRSLWISTPAGADPFCRQVYDSASSRSGWQRWQLQSIQGGWIPLAEIEEARQELDAAMFRQEYCASWEQMAGAVFPHFSEENIRPVIDRNGPLVAGLDFNVSPFVCLIGQAVGDDFEILRELVLNDADTDMMSVRLRALFPGRKILIAPDPTGARRQTSSMGLTDHAILRSHGFHVVAPGAPWRISDKITSVRFFIRSADARRRLTVDPGCTRLIQSLRALEFAEGKSVPDPKSEWGHACDSLGYAVLALKHGLVPPLYRSGNTTFAIPGS